MTSVDIEERTRPQESDTGDQVRAHIVKAPAGRHAEAYVTEARVMGFEVEALCGKRWIPQRDPAKHPICEACAAIMAAMP